MKKFYLLIIVVSFMISCKNEKAVQVPSVSITEEAMPSWYIPVAKDIVTEVVVKPDSTGDPWEMEKVAGYQGEAMINNIFESIYKGNLTVKDYHTGEILKASDVKAFEKEFDNDHSKIGKLSFTENWYYDPVTKSVIKKVKSFTFGYELINNDGKVFGYKALFAVEPVR
jgi:hypothetical protein